MVLVSYVVAVLAAFTTLQLTERLMSSSGRARELWRFGAALVLGCGIWSMHFIAMLAYHSPLKISYAIAPSFASGLVAVIAVWTGLLALNERTSPGRLAVSGAIIGLGSAAMHYIGMAGLQVQADIVYRPLLFALSVFIAFAAAIPGMWLAFNLKSAWQHAVAAAVMGVAICGMHYTGMAATVLVPAPRNIVANLTVPPETLGWIVVSGVMLLIISGFFVAYLDRRLEARGEMEAQRLRALNESLEDRVRQRTAELEEANVRAEAANAAKSAFLAAMSHEIRTPLNGILGMAQALLASTPTPIQRTQLEIIQESGKTLLAVLNDVLDLSKIEAGKLELEETEFDIREMARGCHGTFTGLANAKGLSFALEVEADGAVYRGDPTRLRQVLYNLISNALKFTESGEVRVVVACAGDRLDMSVSDTGIGMSPEFIGRLFGSFSQADASTTRRYGGSGLGLAICRQLVELMGGVIEVESRLGEGSTFKISVPILRVAEARAPAPCSANDTDEVLPTASDLRVLAAEDNAVNQLVLKTLLHQIGVEPVIVANGREAVEAWAAAEFDVVLMDQQMPLMDGMAATRAIREAERAARRAPTPIIALTANAMRHQIETYLAAGMDDHVCKPIEVTKLFAAIERAVSRCKTTEPPAAMAG